MSMLCRSTERGDTAARTDVWPTERKKVEQRL